MSLASEFFRQADAILGAALDVPHERRDALVREMCEDDADLLAAVIRLLEAHEEADRLFGTPAPVMAGFPSDGLPPSPVGFPDVERLGPFRIVSEIGHGGMGIVFLGERIDGQFEQRVALKLIRGGTPAPALVDAFRRERGILARLEHPCIARILDGGITPGGLPWFAMEYVNGRPLDRYCRDTQPPLGARLRMVRDVCDAVAYAHRQHVVHRDIKPTNILVTADGAVKLLDFGVAKLVDERADGSQPEPAPTLWRALTPDYAAPEQLRNDPITPATDVYALGVLLYELLVGERPYRLASRSPAEAERIVCEADVVPPSQAVHRRAVQSSGIPDHRALRGGLDAIVMKALEKEASRRYPSACELSDDLTRFANGSRPTAKNRRVRLHRWRYLPTARVALAGFLMAGGAATAAGVYGSRQSPDPPRERLLIMPFANLTGDTLLEPIGRIAADWISHGAGHAGIADVLPAMSAWEPGRAGSRHEIPDSAHRERAFSAARTAQAGIVVWGSYRTDKDSLRLTAHIMDVASGRDLHTLTSSAGRADTPLSAIQAVRQRLLPILATRADAKLSWLSESSTLPPSFASYKEYAEGADHYLRSAYPQAVQHFDRAVAIDSGFTMAILWGAVARLNMGRLAEVDSITERLIPVREQLPPIDRAMLESMRATVRGDLVGQLTATRVAADAVPGGQADFVAALYATQVNRPREAIARLARVNPDRADLREWMWHWSVLASAHHMLGDHASELRAAREARRRYPDNLHPALWEATALAASGRMDELRDLLEDLPRLRAQGATTTGVALRVIAEELLAHGQSIPARSVAERAVAWYEILLESDNAPPDALAEFAAALYQAGQLERAEEIFRRLGDDEPGNRTYLGYRAVLAAARGDRAEAEILLGLIRSLPTAYAFGAATFWNARVAAELGEKAEAVRLLQAAHQEGFPHGITIHRVREFRALDGDRTFRRFLQPAD